MKRAFALLLPLMLAACGETKPTTPDTVKPTVAFSNLPAMVAQPGALTVTATATDNVQVKEVRFYVGNDLLDTDTSAPYTSQLTFKEMGSYVLKVVAVDTSGNESEPVTQTLRVGTTDGEIPTLDVTGPTAVRTTAPVEFNISASDNVGVSKVTVYEGEKVIETFTQFPAKLTRSFTSADNGTHRYRFVAVDAAGNQSEKSFGFEVNITSAVTDTQKPVVVFGQLPAVITAAGTYPLSVSATDNVGVERISIEVVYTVAGVSTSQIFPDIVGSSGKIDIPVTRELNGRYDVTATAYDAAGNAGRSATNFTVAIP